jgi:hypothetical protein
VTLIGDPDFNEGSESDNGMLLRRGTAATIKNSIVLGFKESGLNIDDSVTFDQANSGALNIENMIFFNNNPNFAPDTEATVAARFHNINVTDPMLRGPYDLVSPDFRPLPESPAINGSIGVSLPPNDSFFEPANFIGAIATDRDPNPDTPYTGNWLAGWTNFSPN